MDNYSLHNRIPFRQLGWLLLITLIFFSSCGSTREMRKTKRAERKVEKLMRKSKRIAIEAGITTTDTIQAIVTYTPAPARIDTVIPESVDSVTIENDDLIITYRKKDNKIELVGEIKPNPKQIKANVAIESTTKTVYKEKPLTRFEQLKLQLGSGLFWWFIVLLLLFIARFILKKYIPWIP